ncbi:MAG: winged helix-turn-helix domain-containing protein [Kineosporiaceae bacterium]
MTAPLRLRPAQARLAALRASGLVGRAPAAGREVTRVHLGRVVRTLGAVQIDSVNVVARAHLVPFYSRLGPYDTAILDRALSRRPRIAVEYWAHEASLVDPALLSAFRWRMARARHEAWGGMSAVARSRPDLLDAVVAAVARRPRTARELSALLDPQHDRRRDHWGWNWTDVKSGVEFLFWEGRVASAGRTAQFERRYAAPAAVWPPEALAPEPPAEADALDVLVDRSAAACGIATGADLRDHFRLPADAAAGAVSRLVAAGRLEPVAVDGWEVPAWRHVSAPVPAAAAARRGVPAATTLLSPFDPLVWTRPRTERVFGFGYRLEIYVPRERRIHGYYVLPFLLRGSLVARVDLRADRSRGVLEVPSAWVEPGAPDDTGEALAHELRRFAGWLGLVRVAPPERGDLAADLGPRL